MLRESLEWKFGCMLHAWLYGQFNIQPALLDPEVISNNSLHCPVHLLVLYRKTTPEVRIIFISNLFLNCDPYFFKNFGQCPFPS